jgi:alpha-L-fucosidase
MKNHTARTTLAALVLALAAPLTQGATLAPGQSATSPAAAEAERTRWFREARLGIFIHWGVYSVPAGEYQGKPVGWIGEWIMRQASIPVADYRAFAKDFTASAYDPEAWADLIQQTGARYTVITAKHHDGFSLYDSAVSDWDVAGTSPAPDDLLSPLASAIRSRGLKFGLYYSQAQDWTHPGGAIMGKKPGEPGWDPAQTGDFAAYIHQVAVPQTREILTRYQPDILWWDTPINMTKELAHPLHDLLALQPRIITNNRLGGGFNGDTKTPEQHIPPRGFPGEMFEVCMTMNETWGFKKNDHDWKSSRTIIRNLSDIASKGGNFLLNIGPDATGRIPEPSVKILQDLGRWMKTNSEAIHATTASPFPRRLPWGRVTQKTADDGTTTLFLHVWDWPADGLLLLPTLQTKPSSARILATNQRASAKLSPDGLVVRLRDAAPDPDVSIVKLTFKKPLLITQRPYVQPAADGTFTLLAHDADTHGSLAGNLAIEGSGASAILARWHSNEFRVEYQLKTPSARTWRVEAEIRAAKPATLRLKNGATEIDAALPATPGDAFQTVTLGTLALPAGETTLDLRPVRDQWSSIDLRHIRLLPAE